MADGIGIVAGVPEGWEPDTVDSYPVAQVFAATLPSGAKMLLRRPNLLSLLQRGDIPNPLIGVVQKAFVEGELAERAEDLAARAEEAGRSPEEQLEWEREQGITDTAEEERTRQVVQAAMEADDAETSDALAYIDVLVYGSVVKPELTFLPPVELGAKVAADGKLSLQVIEDSDKMFVFQWATSQLDGLARFRDDGSGADPERDGGTVRPEAVDAVGAATDA